MLINLRNALMAGKRLPYDAEVEFLQSSGTQWIDTGYSFNSATDKVELVFELLTTTPNYKWIFGAYDSSKRFAIGSGDNANRRTFGYNASTSYYSSTYYTDGAHIFLADSTGASIDGHKFFGFADFSTTSHIILYSIPIDTSTFCSNARIWSYKHYRNSVLVRDYIPVRKGTVGYLYDRVSGKLFGNAGTGDFVLGPDVVPVEYIESHGAEYIDTGVKPSPSTSVETVFAMTTFTANCGLFGARGTASANNNSYNLFIISNNGARVRWDWSGSGQYQTSQAETSTAATYILGAAGGNITRDGTTVMAVSSSKTAINYPLYIFNFNNVGTPFSTGANARFWSVKIYDGQTLGNNFLPVRVGTDATSWEGAMMDVLTRRIYRNAGTGAFTFGDDLKYPISAE